MGNSDHGTTHMTAGGNDGELRPLHYIYVYSIGSRLIRKPKIVRRCYRKSRSSRCSKITHNLTFWVRGTNSST